MKRPEVEEAPESDALAGAPHPRHARRLVGHAAAEAEMLASYRSGRLAHAWLIGGPEGVGKATLAWRFARFMLANPDPSAKPVQHARDLHVDPEQPAVRRLAALAHPDFALVRREWRAGTKSFASEIGVDTVRAAKQIFQLSAAFGGWRIAIVDCAEDLNRSSANALLKIVEEPPARSLLLIVSHRPGQVVPTIRSRCRRLRLDPLSEREVLEVAESLGPPWSEADPRALAAAASRANGSVREALLRLSPDLEGVGALIDQTIASLPHPDPRVATRLAEALSARGSGEGLQMFHRELCDWLADYALKTGSSATRVDELGELWDRLRTAARETDTLNLDRKLHVLAVLAEIAEVDRRRRPSAAGDRI
jgi:DNA polymerase-3 subunit delta'